MQSSSGASMLDRRRGESARDAVRRRVFYVGRVVRSPQRRFDPEQAQAVFEADGTLMDQGIRMRRVILPQERNDLGLGFDQQDAGERAIAHHEGMDRIVDPAVIGADLDQVHPALRREISLQQDFKEGQSR